MSGSRNGFAVNITAVDQASKQIDIINNRIRAMQAPAERLTRSIGKLADTTGITGLANGFRNVARESLQAFENISRIAGPLGVITGAASIAGLARLSGQWANYGSQLLFSSQRSNEAVGTMSALQGAARLAGSSAQSLTAGMTTLKDNIFDINAGRGAPMTIAAFNRLGIKLNDVNTGAMRSASSILPELADKIAAIKDPTMQATLATLTLGAAGEELLPFLRKGSAGIAEYSEKARHYGAMNEAGALAANDLREKQVELSLAVEGLGYSIAETLAPAIGPLLVSLANWIAANRGLISQDLARILRTAVPAAQEFATAVGTISDKIGGVQGAADLFLTFMVGKWTFGMLATLSKVEMAIAVGLTGSFEKAEAAALAFNTRLAQNPALRTLTLMLELYQKVQGQGIPQTPEALDQQMAAIPQDSPLWNGIPEEQQQRSPNSPFYTEQGGGWFSRPPAAKPLATAEQAARAKQAMDYFTAPAQGWTPAQAAALVGAGIQPESGFNTQAGKGTAHQGIAQWEATREAAIEAHFGKSLLAMTYPEQLAAMQWDITEGTRKNVGVALHATTTDRQAAVVVDHGFEAPGNYGVEDPQRIANTRARLNEYQGAPANIQGGTGTGSAPGAPATTTVKGSANVSIKVDGLPPGSRTSAWTEGDLFDGAPRVETGMPFLAEQ